MTTDTEHAERMRESREAIERSRAAQSRGAVKTKEKTETPLYECKGDHGAMCSCMRKHLDYFGWSEKAINNIARAVNSHEALIATVKDLLALDLDWEDGKRDDIKRQRRRDAAFAVLAKAEARP